MSPSGLRSFLAVGAWTLLVVGCGVTDLNVQVLGPGGPFPEETHVRLVEGSACSGATVAGGQVDPQGFARVYAKVCGNFRLVVSLEGYRTFERTLDTCSIHNMEAVLEILPPNRIPASACEQAAHGFVESWINREPNIARGFWADSKAFEPYADGPSRSQPWASRILTLAESAELCRVRARLLYEYGCELDWELELVDNKGNWRVRTLHGPRESIASEQSPE